MREGVEERGGGEENTAMGKGGDREGRSKVIEGRRCSVCCVCESVLCACVMMRETEG